MRDQTHPALFELDTGRQTAALDPIDAICVHDSRLLAIRGDCVEVVDGERRIELDWTALPRWMRSTPEQGPPDEVESEAGSGPDD